MNNNEFDFNFDFLTPEHFTTAVESSGTAVPYDATRPFDVWVDDHVAAVRRTFAATGWAQMRAYLVADGTQWQFAAIPPETLDEFRDRVHYEAMRLEARRLFVNRRTQGGVVYMPAEDLLDPTGPEALRRVVDAGEARDIMFYFAQHRLSRVPNRVQYRHGLMNVVDGVLEEPIEGAADAGGGYYAKILG